MLAKTGYGGNWRPTAKKPLKHNIFIVGRLRNHLLPWFVRRTLFKITQSLQLSDMADGYDWRPEIIALRRFAWINGPNSLASFHTFTFKLIASVISGRWVLRRNLRPWYLHFGPHYFRKDLRDIACHNIEERKKSKLKGSRKIAKAKAWEREHQRMVRANEE
jgi:hypothetical protein